MILGRDGNVIADLSQSAAHHYDHVVPIDRFALEHLLEARDALVREIDRLTTARDELDSVIDRVSASEPESSAPTGQPVTGRAGTGSPVRRGPSAVVTGRARRPRAAGQRPVRAPRARSGGDQKSIRIHVLEMLAGEDRDFGMAEIIERIHAQGIQAHDDAVRSITIKLMKDGTVLRVGRGQYRLAGRPASAPPVIPDAGRALNLAQPWNGPPS